MRIRQTVAAIAAAAALAIVTVIAGPLAGSAAALTSPELAHTDITHDM